MPAQLHHIAALATRPTQLVRRHRIIESALRSMRTGGGALQIRNVAQAAGVAPSTVYRYFSSKDDLLVACLHHWLLEITNNSVTAEYINDPVLRMLDVVDRVTRALCAEPLLADAATSAYLYPDPAAAHNAEQCRNELGRIFAAALDGVDSQHKEFIGNLIADVWALSIPGIIQQRHSIDSVIQRLRTTLAAMGLGNPSALAS